MSKSGHVNTPKLLQAGRRDFHVHTNISPDGNKNSTLENIIKAAEVLGMEELGLTDHVYDCCEGALGFKPWGEYRDPNAHRQLCATLRTIRSRVRLYASWEVDYFDGGRYSFDPIRHLPMLDYVLLGHHFAAHVENKPPAFLADYLMRITMEMACEPYANIIAHPFYFPASAQRHGAILSCLGDKRIVEVFQAIKENGKAAEITPFQFNVELRDVEQMKRVYALARTTGVKFTLDSDAHSISEMLGGLGCLYVLAELGFTDDDFVDYQELKKLKNNKK